MNRGLDWRWIAIGTAIMFGLNLVAGLLLVPLLGGAVPAGADGLLCWSMLRMTSWLAPACCHSTTISRASEGRAAHFRRARLSSSLNTKFLNSISAMPDSSESCA